MGTVASYVPGYSIPPKGDCADVPVGGVGGAIPVVGQNSSVSSTATRGPRVGVSSASVVPSWRIVETFGVAGRILRTEGNGELIGSCMELVGKTPIEPARGMCRASVSCICIVRLYRVSVSVTSRTPRTFWLAPQTRVFAGRGQVIVILCERG